MVKIESGNNLAKRCRKCNKLIRPFSELVKVSVEDNQINWNDPLDYVVYHKSCYEKLENKKPQH
jgi:hypothetical protein